MARKTKRVTVEDELHTTIDTVGEVVQDARLAVRLRVASEIGTLQRELTNMVGDIAYNCEELFSRLSE